MMISICYFYFLLSLSSPLNQLVHIKFRMIHYNHYLEYVANDLRYDCVKWTILYQIHNWSYVHNFFLKGVEYCVRNCNRESNFRQVSARKNTRTELEFVFPLLRLQLVIGYGQWAVAWGGWTGPACFVQQSRRERQRESVGMARGAAKISKSTSMFKTKLHILLLFYYNFI